MADSDGLITERLNAEPAIFKGCSLSELSFMVGGATIVWLPACVMLAGIFGSFTMGFGVAGVLIVLTVIILSSVFRRLKLNRPNGYYQLAIHRWLAKEGIVKSPFITRSGVWDLGRS